MDAPASPLRTDRTQHQQTAAMYIFDTFYELVQLRKAILELHRDPSSMLACRRVMHTAQLVDLEKLDLAAEAFDPINNMANKIVTLKLYLTSEKALTPDELEPIERVILELCEPVAALLRKPA